MTRHVMVKLSLTKDASLASATKAFLVLPIVAIATIGAQSARPQAGGTISATPTVPRFEVASIKPAAGLPRSQGVPLGLRMDKAQASFGGMSLSALISYAYGVKLAQISAPEWLTTQRFDIVAKLPEEGSTARAPEMMQGLLAERFGLKLHRDSKDFAVYVLVAANGGTKLTPKPEDFDAAAHKDQMALPILSLTLLLEQIVDLPVIDETGQQGQYLFSSQAIRQAMMAGTTAKSQQGTAGGSADAGEAPEPASASVAALLLPLGMKLEKKKANLPVLVVDRILQTPIEN